jgi:hypothetical protein
MQYIGKDVLTQGALLRLDPKKAWNELRSRAKQGIRKAQKAGIHMVESRDLDLMAKVWYNPDTLCQTLEPDQKLFLGYVGDELVGGIIVTPITPNTLFYHYGGTNDKGKVIEANAYLLWHIVEVFQNSEFKYLDVGVSFRPELQHYFQKYCTQPYPILFHPPATEVLPKIGLNPFSFADLAWEEQQSVAINTQLWEHFEAEFTYLPSWPYALQSALRGLKLLSGAIVGVWASVGEQSYLEELNRLFGDHFAFKARAENAQAHLVCHRWGVLFTETESLANDSVPLIEDCRDALMFRSEKVHPGSYGKFAVFDFARWFPMQFGAALVGEFVPDRGVWDDFHCLDVTKRNVVREQLQIHWPKRSDYAIARRANWKHYRELFALLGLKPAAPMEDAPAVFLLKEQLPYHAQMIQDRLTPFGITTEIDVHDGTIALPCHSALNPHHIDYIFGAFRGMVNPCHAFVRSDPTEAKL